MEPSQSPILEMIGIKKAFVGNPVLHGVDFDCRAGEIHGLVGENGAGKSTLMKILAGVHARDAGEIRIDGGAVAFEGYDQARRAGVCVVYQELSLFPRLSVAENIVLGRWPRGRLGLTDWRHIRTRVGQALARVGLEGLDVNLLVDGLPMAVRQRIEVAKALLDNPRIIVFDEPTTTLSEEEAERLFGLMRGLRGEGRGVIFISHRLKEVLGNCDRITVMKDGQKVATDAASAFDENRLIVTMVGRELSNIYPPKAARTGSVIFARRAAAGNAPGALSFEVREGEVLGVGGLAGQGQIPMLESIFGMGGTPATVTVRGRDYVVGSPRDAMRAGIALIPEDRNGQAAFPILSIADNIAAASLDRHSRFGAIRRLAELRAVRAVAASLNVKMTSLAQEVMYLSGGNIQKTVFARWLLADPKVMVLLSPTSGIDVGTKQQIYGLIRDLANRGVAIIVLTGDMMELIGLCDRVLVMYNGEINGELAGGEITERNIMKTSVRRGS